jgi:4-hydroxybenzoate polyprenyltransferase
MSSIIHYVIQYIERNLHVSLALVSLVLLTYHYSATAVDWVYVAFAGMGTLVTYTYIKNVPPQVSIIFGVKQVLKQGPFWIHILALIALSLVLVLNQSQRLILVVITILCLGYILPRPMVKRREKLSIKQQTIPSTLRDFGPIKIVIVALVWGCATVLIPILSSRTLNLEIWWLFIAQTLWVVVLTIPFEIRDAVKDQLRQPTWPQKLGLTGVKVLGSSLLVISMAIHLWLFSKAEDSSEDQIVFVSVPYAMAMILTLLGLIRAKAKQSYWYSAFWIEAIPIAWLILYCLNVFMIE